MKLVNNIVTLIVAIIFLISSSGYVMYKSNCLCIGEKQTSVFVRPNTCKEDFHVHHTHDKTNAEVVCAEHKCHECSEHEKSCGCESPEFFFFKLKDKAIDDEVKFVLVYSPELIVAFSEVLAVFDAEDDDLYLENINSDPPPKITTSLDFLIQIQQLKIPVIA